MAKIHSTFKTKKGTELPLLDLRGKPYLQVAHRLVWFREDHPTAIIKTQMLSDTGEEVIFRAEIYLSVKDGQPQMVATAHKRESKKTFADNIEKGETGAIGRALAMAGYGTQFTGDELDEGDRLADAPVDKATKKASFRKPKVETVNVGDDI